MIWDGYVKPFRIFGNLYFVGTVPASTHLIDTGEGLILIDTGYQQSLYLVLNGVWELGFSPYEIRWLLHTHGHIDHFGATRALVELTGAKTFIGKPDRAAADGSRDLSYARELGMEFRETFTPDVLLEDGDEMCLGNTVVRAVATPGHTAGAMSYFFDVTDGRETFRAALHGGMGTNSLEREYLERYGLPFSLRDDYRRSMLRLSGEKADIFLGNHLGHNHTLEKRERLLAGDRYAFVDREEWKAFNLWCVGYLDEMIKKEEGAR